MLYVSPPWEKISCEGSIHAFLSALAGYQATVFFTVHRLQNGQNSTADGGFPHIEIILLRTGSVNSGQKESWGFLFLWIEKSRNAKKRSGHGGILLLFCEFQLIDQLEGMFGAIHQIGGIVHKQSGQTHTALLANLLKGGIIVPHLQELTEIANAGGNVDIDKAYIVLGKNLFHRGAGLSKGAAIQNNFTHKRVPPFNYQCNQ